MLRGLFSSNILSKSLTQYSRNTTKLQNFSTIVFVESITVISINVDNFGVFLQINLSFVVERIFLVDSPHKIEFLKTKNIS